MIQQVKLSFLLATLIGIGFNLDPLINSGDVNWIGWLISYFVCFGFIHFYLSNSKVVNEQEYKEPLGSVSSAHLEALYKQAMIVERNAQKANIVFSQQLKYVKNILHKAKHLSQGDDFELSHGTLIKELDVLEHHLERLLSEMQKNVKLGEKLQQSVANIDPELGVV